MKKFPVPAGFQCRDLRRKSGDNKKQGFYQYSKTLLKEHVLRY